MAIGTEAILQLKKHQKVELARIGYMYLTHYQDKLSLANYF